MYVCYASKVFRFNLEMEHDVMKATDLFGCFGLFRCSVSLSILYLLFKTVDDILHLIQFPLLLRSDKHIFFLSSFQNLLQNKILIIFLQKDMAKSTEDMAKSNIVGDLPENCSLFFRY